jgi:hypothetical protein
MGKGGVIPFVELYATMQCTRSCEWCLIGAVKERVGEMTAEPYLPWLGRMAELGIGYSFISVLGGEPFLHPDLEGFVRKLRAYKPVKITTNGFWMRDGVEKWAGVLELVDILTVSHYPDDPGVPARVEELRRRHPRITYELKNVERFQTWRLLPEAEEPSGCCRAHEWKCIWLGPDGRLAKCWAALHTAKPEAAAGFKDACADGMFYDLSGDGEGFEAWRDRYPLPACRWCSAWRKEEAPWREKP